MFEDDKELYPMIEEYFRGQVKPTADSLGWNDTGNHIIKLLRASVFGLACKTGDREALDNACRSFQRRLTGTVRLPVNLRLLVYRHGMQNSGDETPWNYVLDQYQKTSLAQEKEKLLYGLASVKNVTLFVKRTSNDNIKPRHSSYAGYVFRQTFGKQNFVLIAIDEMVRGDRLGVWGLFSASGRNPSHCRWGAGRGEMAAPVYSSVPVNSSLFPCVRSCQGQSVRRGVLRGVLRSCKPEAPHKETFPSK
ncbi:Glutamyl aminopeptidase [Manis javanica]|nr:Glutamyl aminopeptidase [Manis javanica]